jgi:DNA polymerase-3 subunit gamma/tau
MKEKLGLVKSPGRPAPSPDKTAAAPESPIQNPRPPPNAVEPAPPPWQTEDSPPPWLEQIPPWDEVPSETKREPQPSSVVSSTNSGPAAPALDLPKLDWPTMIQQMGLVGMSLQLANHCILQAVDNDRVILKMDAEGMGLRTPQMQANLEKALQAHLQRPIKLSIQTERIEQETPALQQQRQKEARQKSAEEEIEQDPLVRALKERLDARIVPGSIKPVD